MSNLLEKASILLTPTAYDDGKILSVKPEPILGSELVVNGGFDTDSDWTKGTGWSISGGVANCDGTNAALLFQSLSGTTTNDTFKVTYTISNYISGSVFVGFGSGLNQPNGTTRNANGTYTEYLTKTSVSTSFGFKSISFIGSIDNVSVKQEIDGDFDFTRNSSATRVNSQGLIEDVQILSSNLVSNGDFSQEGSELVTNGDFATDSDWNKQTSNWTIVNGYAVCDGLQTSNSSLFQDLAVISGKSYRIDFTITNSVNNLNLILGATTIGQYGSGTHSIYVTKDANASARIFFQATASNNFSGSIDNVSVKEVGQDWTLGTGWSIGGNQLVRAVAVSGSYAQTSYDLGVIGRLYKISINVAEVLSGTLYVYGGLGGTPALTITSAGVYTINHIWASDQPLGVFCNNSFTGSITNISVIEITEDTNLPRIDYTGGEGHWLFEPQSTNRMTTSEPTSGGAGFTFPAKTWANGLINGLNATEASSGTKYWYMSSGIANEYSTFSFFVEMEDGSEPIIGGSTDANSDFVVTVKGWFMAENDITKTNTIGNVWKIEAPSRVNELAGTGPIGILKYSGQSNKTFSATGFQIEQNSFATSYIPTEGAIKTRLQDAAFGAGSSDLINSTEGVLYAEIAALANDSSNRVIQLSDGTNSNRIFIGYWSLSNEIRMLVQVGGVTQAFSGNTSYDILDFNKIAFKYKESDFALWINGVEVFTDTSGITFPIGTLSQLDFDSNGSAYLYGKAKCVAVFKEALTDAELTCLTTI
jgi:hypothetical protein